MVSERTAQRKIEEAEQFINSGDSFKDFNISWSDSEGSVPGPDTVYEHRSLGFSEDIMETLKQIVQTSVEKEITRAFEDQSKGFDSFNISNSDLETVPLQYLEVDDIPRIDRFRPLLEEESFRGTAYSDAPTPDFQTIRLKDGTEPNIVAFQKFSKRQILGRTWKVKFPLAGEGEYDIFDDNLMGIPERIDALYYDGVMFVINPSKFEDIFDYVDDYREQASEVYDELYESDITIHNFPEFRNSVNNDRRALRKMRKARERGIYQELSQDDVEDIIYEFDLDISTTVRNGAWGIDIPDMRKKWDVIRILNDDHVLSFLQDDQKYQITGGKREA